MSEKPNNGLPEVFMHSFTMPCAPTERNEKMVRTACEMRCEDLRNEAALNNRENETSGSKVRHSCTLKYEVSIGMNNIRVNLYGGTTKDAMMIGYNFCTLQMNPSWK